MQFSKLSDSLFISNCILANLTAKYCILVIIIRNENVIQKIPVYPVMKSRTDSLNDFWASRYASMSKSREVIAYVFKKVENTANNIHTTENLSQNLVGLMGFKANHPFSSILSHGLTPRYLFKNSIINQHVFTIQFSKI